MEESSLINGNFIKKLTSKILENLDNENFGVKELAAESGMSLYRLNKKLYSINKKTSNQFIREIRLQKALEMLHDEAYTVAEVSFKTGFGSPNYFNKCFHSYYGFPPGEVRNRAVKNQEQNISTSAIPENKLTKPVRKTYLNSMPGILFLALLLGITGFSIFLKISRSERVGNLISSDGRIAIAVMPFRNLTNDSTWNIWQEGIQTSLITALSNSEELRVRQTESVRSLLHNNGLTDYASLSPSVAGKISRKLDANVFIYGSIIHAGSAIRLNAQIFGSDKKEALKSFEIEGSDKQEMIFQMIDSLKQEVKNFLIISKLINKGSKPDHLPPVPDISPETFRYCISGDKAFAKLDYTTAIEMYMLALKIDSNIYNLYGAISKAYYNQDQYEKAKTWCLKLYDKLEMMNMKDKILASFWYVFLFKTPNESIRYIKQFIDLDDENPGAYYMLGDKYLIIEQYDKAIQAFEKALEIYKRWDIKPGWIGNYSELGEAYHKRGEYKKEKKLYRKAEKDFPDDILLPYQQAILALAEGDTVAANRFLLKCKSNWKELSWSESRIEKYLGDVYSEGGIQEKAEKYYRQALSLEPENPLRMNNLAYFLIEKGQNINEGMELLDRALKLSPGNYNFIHSKGWGLYKQGKNKEAMKLLEKADSLKPIYNHLLFLHLGEVKKAISGL